MDITLYIEIVLFIVLMAFSGFFSSSETSLFSLSKLQLEQMNGLRHVSAKKSGCTGRTSG